MLDKKIKFKRIGLFWTKNKRMFLLDPSVESCSLNDSEVPKTFRDIYAGAEKESYTENFIFIREGFVVSICIEGNKLWKAIWEIEDEE